MKKKKKKNKNARTSHFKNLPMIFLSSYIGERSNCKTEKPLNNREWYPGKAIMKAPGKFRPDRRLLTWAVLSNPGPYYTLLQSHRAIVARGQQRHGLLVSLQIEWMVRCQPPSRKHLMLKASCSHVGYHVREQHPSVRMRVGSDSREMLKERCRSDDHPERHHPPLLEL